MNFVKIVALLLIFTLVSCQKEEVIPTEKENLLLHQKIMNPVLHNTSTSLNIPKKDCEVIFSFILSSNVNTKDAVVFYSVDSQDYDRSIYLTKGVNIADRGFEQGIFTNGVKAAMKGFNTRKPENRHYYFKIIRLGESEQYFDFGIKVLNCGNIVLSCSNKRSNRVRQVVTYYIKTGADESIEYVNVRIE